MRIGIVGVGMVGETLLNWFKKNTDHDIFCYDPGKELKDNLLVCEYIFLCVPVPTNKNYNQELHILNESLSMCLGSSDLKGIFIRSTVLPGTSEALCKNCHVPVVHMPEFFTERQCEYDMDNLPILSGGIEFDGMEQIISKIFPGKEIKMLTNSEAEMTKYTHNVFGAVKVNFFNMINKACETNGIDYEKVRENIFITDFINKEHTLVPGPDGKKGYGGKCLPKDTKAFCGWLRDGKVSNSYLLSLGYTIFENEIHRNEGQAQ